jgi:hypothetical protein
MLASAGSRPAQNLSINAHNQGIVEVVFFSVSGSRSQEGLVKKVGTFLTDGEHPHSASNLLRDTGFRQMSSEGRPCGKPTETRWSLSCCRTLPPRLATASGIDGGRFSKPRQEDGA